MKSGKVVVKEYEQHRTEKIFENPLTFSSRIC